MPIEATGEFSFQDIFRGSLLLARGYLLKSGVLGVISLGGGIFLGLYTDDWGDWLALVICGIVILIFPWFLMIFRSYKALKSPVLSGSVHYKFDSNGMQFEGTHSQGTLKWTGIPKYKEDKNTFLFYTSSKQGSSVPKRFFSSVSDVEAVRELIRSGIPPRK